MNQSCACSVYFAKTNEKDASFRVPQSSSLPGSHAQKSSGVEIEQYLWTRYCQSVVPNDVPRDFDAVFAFASDTCLQGVRETNVGP